MLFRSIQLTSYVQSFNLDIIKKAIEVTGKNYKSNTYVHQTLYAKWVLEKNGKEALEYLQAEENKDWSSLPIIAIADLNYKEALPVLETMITEKQEPVVVEILLEGITRQKNQKTAPDTNDRMIWLNGNVSPNQRALGIESDNVFIKRAQQKQPVDATVYETDED